MVNLAYNDVFAVRGGPYHQAMLLYPHARDQEFSRLFDRYPVRSGQTVLDIPAGGGYLSGHLCGGVDLVSLELTDGFSPSLPVVSATGEWGVGEFDHVVCLAALHHIDDQSSFIRRLLSHTKPGGVVHLADVSQNSPIASFLDGFVDAHNGTGHRGQYLSDHPDGMFAGMEIGFHASLDCPWQFKDESQMGTFCMGLFGLAGCTREALIAEMRSLVGLSHAADSVQLNWRLTYIDICRSAV